MTATPGSGETDLGLEAVDGNQSLGSNKDKSSADD